MGLLKNHLLPQSTWFSVGKSQWLEAAKSQGIDEKEALAMYAEAEARESRIIGAFTSRITGREMTYIAYRNR
jgi:hypothetical protein